MLVLALCLQTSIAAPSAEVEPAKRIIKVLPPKSFQKIGRLEVATHLGEVVNDPFIRRHLIGAGFTWHLTDIVGVELSGTFSPDLGRADWKPLTKQIVDNNHVTPDISKVIGMGGVHLQFAPIYGKTALNGRIVHFDLFGSFGIGAAHTVDDLEALGKIGDPVAESTRVQTHPSLDTGVGLRVAISRDLTIRLEGRGVSYLEVLESTTLEMKNNLMFLAGMSVFFPSG